MNYVKLKTTKYVRQSFKQETVEKRAERRREASRNILLIAACFAIFVTSIYLAVQNPEWLDTINNYF